jgi:hypothetical protein
MFTNNINDNNSIIHIENLLANTIQPSPPPSSHQYDQNQLQKCIVVGCKNGFNSVLKNIQNNEQRSEIKLYQVPNILVESEKRISTININSNNNDNREYEITPAKQWYINTLREDLLNSLLNQNGRKMCFYSKTSR